MYRFDLGAPGVYEGLLGALYWLEGPGRLFGVGCFFGDLLPDGRKLLGGDYCRGMFTALDLALVGMLMVIVTESTNYTKLSKKIIRQRRRFSKLKPV